MTKVCRQCFRSTFTHIRESKIDVHMFQEQSITDGGRYLLKTDKGRTSLTINDVVQEDCDKYTIVVRNSVAAHAAFASLAVGS